MKTYKKVIVGLLSIGLLTACSNDDNKVDKSNNDAKEVVQEQTTQTENVNHEKEQPDTMDYEEEKEERKEEPIIQELDDKYPNNNINSEYIGLYKRRLDEQIDTNNDEETEKSVELYNEIIKEAQEKGQLSLDYAALAFDTFDEVVSYAIGNDAWVSYNQTMDFLYENMPAFVDASQASENFIENYNNIDGRELPQDPDSRVPIIKVIGNPVQVYKNFTINGYTYNTALVDGTTHDSIPCVIYYIGNVDDELYGPHQFRLWAYPVCIYNHPIEGTDYGVDVIYLVSGPGLQQIYPDM